MKRITQDSISSPLAKKLENCLQEISFIHGFPIVQKIAPIFLYFFILTKLLKKLFNIQ